MAFEYFREKKVDFQVVEVGLGGSLDATNLVNPDVCVITSISLDHVSTLGDTIGQIALAKAGIIKDGVPVVVAPQNGEVMKVIGEVATLKSAPLSQVGEEFSWECLQSDERGQHIEIHGSQETYRTHLPLLGDYQIENAAAAIGAIETLSNRGVTIPGDSIAQGLSRVVWPARLQKITCTKSALVDGAHNPDSMRRLMNAIQDNFEFRHLYVVFGTGVGHLTDKMFAELCRFSPLVIAVKSRDPRAASAERVACMSRNVGLKVVGKHANVADGVREGVSLAGDGDIVLGTGSLFVAAEMIEELEGIQPEIYLGLEKQFSRMGGSI
jgi:dihydrofolate synthase/folylpolyglutamate synthase